MSSRLKVIQVEGKTTSISKKATYEQIQKEYWEKFWAQSQEPTLLENERIEWVKTVLKKFPTKVRLADLGCGRGALSYFAWKSGHQVTAVDIASNALKCLDEIPVTKIQECLPYLKLPDQTFDAILCLDVIAELQENLHRLLISEISRLLMSKGLLVCSTPLDLGSWDAYSKFLQLLGTEFEILEIHSSYHRLFLLFSRLFSTSSLFLKAIQNADYRQERLLEKKGLYRALFALMSKPIFKNFWRGMEVLFHPLRCYLHRSHRLLGFLERISETLWGNQARTHVFVLACKKSLF